MNSNISSPPVEQPMTPSEAVFIDRFMKRTVNGAAWLSLYGKAVSQVPVSDSTRLASTV